MPTPYDNHDTGYSREEREMAARYGIDLDAPEKVECGSCFKPHDVEALNASGNCLACVELMRSEEALAFVTAPSMAGLISLMGVR